jgi:D-alanine--poly(phosphoribitol) ligase subunit 1
MIMYYAYNLGNLFSEVLQQSVNNIAIQYQEKAYTYLELDEDSNTVAINLHRLGLKRGDVVAIIHSKEYLSFVLMLACLKTGIIYTNIDPESPVERFRNMLEIAAPVRIFTDQFCSPELNKMSLACGVVIESINSLLSNQVGCSDTLHAICQMLDGDTIAYIMFTSGSTGKPKGVVITHQNLLHFINWSASYFHITPKDRVANVNPMFFDNSVFDFYTAIFSGACLVPVKKQLLSSAKLLINFIDEMECTIWFSVPSLLIYLMTMRVLTADSFQYVRAIVFGGEGYPKVELKKLFDLYSSRIKFVNVYGPTEGTCICSSYELTAQDFVDLSGLPPLGYINPNFSYLIQNSAGECDNEGELCLLGPNVGRGYFNNPDITAKAFVEQTGHGFYRAKMYRTGDIVTLKDGLLYFIGRKDNQVKHMGYRIELEEIELAIGLISEVTQVAVIYQKTTTLYGKIIAYVASQAPLEQEYIRNKISTKLPSYMLPNLIMLMQHLPKNPNGKIDKAALKLLAETEVSA